MENIYIQIRIQVIKKVFNSFSLSLMYSDDRCIYVYFISVYNTIFLIYINSKLCFVRFPLKLTGYWEFKGKFTAEERGILNIKKRDDKNPPPPGVCPTKA